jgi:hypothetical protein
MTTFSTDTDTKPTLPPDSHYGSEAPELALRDAARKIGEYPVAQFRTNRDNRFGFHGDSRNAVDRGGTRHKWRSIEDAHRLRHVTPVWA